MAFALERTTKRPLVCLVFGALLSLASLALAVGWSYFLAPMRHRGDQSWLEAHSVRAQWEEEQAMYRRIGSSPDLMFRPDKIHLYGDKFWFQWLLHRIENGASDFRVCGCTFSCLNYMSNQSHDSEDEWKSWYEKNRDKTQEQWLQDGFALAKVTVSLPPSKSDEEPLLSLLGKLSDDPKRTNYKLERSFEAAPFVRYNAFRWLRDMGFEPVGYLLENDASKLRPEIIAGIKHYRRFEYQMPRSNGVGLLNFGIPDPNAENLGFIWGSNKFLPYVGYAASILISGCGLAGYLLFRRGLRGKRLSSP